MTGNTVIDALHSARSSAGAPSRDPALTALVASERPILLVTAHRRESWGERMTEAMARARDVADQAPRAPASCSPCTATRSCARWCEPTLLDQPNVLLTEPLSYHEFAHVLAGCRLVVTDSGGVQEEAPSLGKPVLVMRDNTERPEAVVAGTVKLVGTDRELVRDETLAPPRGRCGLRRHGQRGQPLWGRSCGGSAAAAIAHLLGSRRATARVRRARVGSPPQLR